MLSITLVSGLTAIIVLLIMIRLMIHENEVCTQCGSLMSRIPRKGYHRWISKLPGIKIRYFQCPVCLNKFMVKHDYNNNEQ